MKYRGFTIIIAQDITIDSDCDEWYEYLLLKGKGIWHDPTYHIGKECTVFHAKEAVDFMIDDYHKRRRHIGSRKNTFKRWYNSKKV